LIRRKEQINGAKGERFYDPTFMSLNNTDPLTVSQITTNTNFNRLGAFVITMVIIKIGLSFL
jgi:hypothetical protein